MNENIDTTNPLDIDLSSIDTSFPVIKEGLYDLELVNTDVKTNEAQTLMLEYGTIAQVPGSNGDTLERGAKVFGTLNLAATGKAKPMNIARNAGEFVQAFGDLTKGWSIAGIKENHAKLRGAIIRCRVGIQTAGPDRNGVYRKARNTIAEYVRK